MNNPGLYASIYQQIREFAELVDTVLVSIKSGTSEVHDPGRQRLGNLLISLSGDTWDSLPTRMIALLLRDKDNSNKQKWAKLGHALLSPQPVSSITKDLEDLAVTLEQEQVGNMTKMRGNLR